MKLCKDCKRYGKCGRFYSSMSNYAEECKDFDEIKPTNFERIKAMSVEKMAEFLAHISTDCEKFCVFVDENGDCIGCGGQCAIGIKQWLESEVQEDD